MEFIHRPYIPGETIAAIATPPGEGGIAIIRITGNDALNVASKVFSGPVKSYLSHTAHLGFVKDSFGETIDEVLLLVFLGKRSFAGEDTVEIHCHGGELVSRKVLERVLEAGSRNALPGEFSFKAFMNGKMDLTQAEAISSLISAKNEMAFKQAAKVLEGTLSKKIHHFQKEIISIAAIFEAWVDFPEEGLEFASIEEILEKLERLRDELKHLLETFHDGKKVQTGISLCIAGAPNVGKSSLMNALLNRERAIVTEIAGTTRDILEEDLVLQSLHFRLMDTAGIRETSDVIEKEGIKRSKAAIEEADLILFLLDATKVCDEEEKRLLKQLKKEKTLVVWNKIDLKDPIELDFPHVAKISAKEKVGLEDLKKKIQALIWKKGMPAKEELLLTSSRHKEALTNAHAYLEKIIQGLNEKTSPEFLSFDLRQSLFELGTIIGKNVTEEILSSIFSQFCIGK